MERAHGKLSKVKGALSSETLFLGVIRRDIESFLLLFVNIFKLSFEEGFTCCETLMYVEEPKNILTKMKSKLFRVSKFFVKKSLRV